MLVDHGYVTLEWEYQRAAAANAVRRLRGVVGVRNELAIGV